MQPKFVGYLKQLTDAVILFSDFISMKGIAAREIRRILLLMREAILIRTAALTLSTREICRRFSEIRAGLGWPS